ncbi:MAG TPA: hypothetical protein VFL90_02140 [Methylomirabilota bacterium]|nr:hypothetical protein [Methylomirabilota bacterium]
MNRYSALAALGALLLAVSPAVAGPPYVTDDPEPVEYHNGELYLATQVAHDKGGWSGTGPHFEANYGIVPDVMLHLIAPMVFDLPADEGTGRYGYGDTEVGVKYRFVHEGKWTPMVGTFPLLELPTGNERNGLGSGHLQTFLPLWLQKSWGDWTTYGGAGYWIIPGEGNRNYWFVGWLLQRKITEAVAVGAEIFHTTPKESHGPSETRMSVGLVVDFTEHHHLLFSAGPGLQGPTDFQGYLAYQYTFGPRPPEGDKEPP